MSMKISAISWSLVILLLLGSLFLYRELRETGSRLSREEGLRRGLTGQLEELQGKLEALRAELARAAARRARVERERKSPAGETTPEEPAATTPSVTAPSTGSGQGPAILASVQEADRLAEELLQKGDLRGIILLAGDLISLGEEGYEKLYTLARLLDDRENLRHFEALWRQEELFMGSFLRTVADNHEEILRFGLFLDTKKREEMPEVFQGLHKELSDELGPLLLGYYQGDDPEIFDGYMERYRAYIEDDLERGRLDQDRLWGVAQIPTEESENFLIDLLPKAPEKSKADVLRALAWQGGERALPVLRAQLQTATDPKLIAAIEAMINYLE